MVSGAKTLTGTQVRARAPLRISFAGGGTDVDPYPAERGGRVLNAAINRYAYCTIAPRPDDAIEIRSQDIDTVIRFERNGARAEGGGPLRLVEAALAGFGDQLERRGFDVTLHTDASPGSGLGASSAVVVALVGALREHLGLPMGAYEIAERAYRLERIDAGIPGGRQDQYAAAFGGFNYIEFTGRRTVVNPLRIDPGTASELEYRMVLAYTGGSRASAGILTDQVARYRRGDADTCDALDRQKALAAAMKEALLTGDLDGFAEMLNEAWTAKRRMSPLIATPRIDAIWGAARGAGAVGGKISGAGGAGFMFFVVDPDRRREVVESLRAMDCQVLDFSFDRDGLTSWRVDRAEEPGEVRP